MDLKRILSTMSFACLAVAGVLMWNSVKAQKADTQDTSAGLETKVVGQETVAAEEPKAAPVMTDQTEVQEDLHLEIVEAGDGDNTLTLGSISDEAYKALITFDKTTASVTSVKINGYKLNVNDEEFGYPLLNTSKSVTGDTWQSFMLDSIKIDGVNQKFVLRNNCWRVLDSSSDQIRFVASILKGEDKYLDVIKIFKWEPGEYEMDFAVEFVNHTSGPVDVKYIGMSGPTGILREDTRSDRRNVFVGYYAGENKFETELANPEKVKKDGSKLVETKDRKPLEWFAYGNKFFTAIVRPLPKGEALAANYISHQVLLKTVQLASGPEKRIGLLDLVPYTQFVPGEVAASATSKYNFKIYLGPIDKELFEQEPFRSNHYDATAKGPSCAVCTFSWLNAILFKLMQFCHMVTGNYGLSIIFLVFLVRLALHPITKKSQVNMHKMSKLGPKMEEIKKKYGDNQKELQRQMAMAYKDIGFNPLMGCLPMVLQMPIWIALYSSVDSNIGLRHEGLFPAGFPWLNDLSAPDRLIPFTMFGVDNGITLPLLGNVDAFNILPILLTIAMFFQSKVSMAQNQSATMTPEQAQQQKMMMYMMPGMMLLFFYTAPSGLNLYIMASTFAGLIEQKRIKQHLKEQEEAQKVGVVDVKAKVLNKMGEKKKKPKGPYKKF